MTFTDAAADNLDALPPDAEITPEAEEQMLASLSSLSLKATEEIRRAAMTDTFIFYSTVPGLMINVFLCGMCRIYFAFYQSLL